MRVQIRVLVVAGVVGTAALGAVPAIVTSGPSTSLANCGTGYYKNSDGQCIPHPSPGQPSNGTPGLPANGVPGLVGSDGPATGPSGPPPGATARCRDGDYSYSTHHTGTCSGHGGVSQWLNN
ncbi:DUF3761 domain-containing protein [Mycobacterium sp. Marseille-P9652]|uniref:DUF3761 domain-containing protein n=1 Tax=Mycobacterium sp. Marseille-P9652 TaxID=2654950 RepID=UPI0012E7644F|nr:DUF3761 domain-containing protein [Mycobacterium sp. Marseille-P9652]